MFSIIEQLTLYYNIPDGSVAGLSCNLDFWLYLSPASHYFGWNGVLFLFYNTESFTRV